MSMSQQPIGEVDLKQKPVSFVLDLGLHGYGTGLLCRSGWISLHRFADEQSSRHASKEIDRKLDRVLEALARLERAK